MTRNCTAAALGILPGIGGSLYARGHYLHSIKKNHSNGNTCISCSLAIEID
jgi:hypothetical protein